MLEIDWAREFLGQMSAVFMREFGDQIKYSSGLYDTTEGVERTMLDIKNGGSEFSNWVYRRIGEYEGGARYSSAQEGKSSPASRRTSYAAAIAPQSLKQRSISTSSQQSNGTGAPNTATAANAAVSAFRTRTYPVSPSQKSNSPPGQASPAYGVLF
jgi:hypothetical protein